MIDMLPIQTSELCPLSTRLLPKELSHAFGLADDTYDSQQTTQAAATPAVHAPVSTPAHVPVAQAGSSAADAQRKRKATEQQQQHNGPAPAASAPGNAPRPAASLTHSFLGAAAHTAPVHAAQGAQSALSQQQQATSGISAGLQQQPALQAAAAMVGGQLRGFPAAYISPHGLLPYGQQAVAALPTLSGALPLAMYSPDITTMMALQQQQQQQQQLDDAEEMSARALKRPRLVWTPQLHKKFEEAVQKIGVNKAVPKTIMQMMDVEGLTRENVASHLQKYRLSLKKGPDGEFITTITEGTETSGAAAAGAAGEAEDEEEEEPAGSGGAGATTGAAGAAAAAAAAGTATEAGTAAGNDNGGDCDDDDAAGGDGSDEAAAGSDSADGDAAGGESSDAGTGAVAGSSRRDEAGTDAAPRSNAAAAAGGLTAATLSPATAAAAAAAAAAKGTDAVVAGSHLTDAVAADAEPKAV